MQSYMLPQSRAITLFGHNLKGFKEKPAHRCQGFSAPGRRLRTGFNLHKDMLHQLDWFRALRPPQKRSVVATSRQGAFDGYVRR
jgi:hypothetical protein